MHHLQAPFTDTTIIQFIRQNSLFQIPLSIQFSKKDIYQYIIKYPYPTIPLRATNCKFTLGTIIDKTPPQSPSPFLFNKNCNWYYKSIYAFLTLGTTKTDFWLYNRYRLVSMDTSSFQLLKITCYSIGIYDYVYSSSTYSASKNSRLFRISFHRMLYGRFNTCF